MKKTIIGIAVVLSLSGQAFAGDYGDAVNNQRICEGKAKHAAAIFTLKEAANDPVAVARLASKGISPTREFFMKDAESGEYADRKIREMAIFNVSYVFDKAVDKKDAYMAAWGNCMDMLN